MPETERPATLGDVANQDLAGFQVTVLYYLELVHGLMGFFPAITADDGEMFVCTSREVLETIRASLPDRESKISSFTALVHLERGFAFSLDSSNGLESKSVHVLGKGEEESRSFKWASGLI